MINFVSKLIYDDIEITWDMISNRAKYICNSVFNSKKEIIMTI